MIMRCTYRNTLTNVLRITSNGVMSFSTALTKMAEPLVTVQQGQLKGAVLRLLDESLYYSFKGIPYAHVPARFMAPTPPTAWQGVLDATKHGPQCTQYEWLIREVIEGSQNCLLLNIYTKSLDTKAKLPVMVFIHGGAYMFGSGDDTLLGPEFLLQHDVILVTINYRLEAFGFLCLDTPEVPGNAGMKDQVAALRWVQNNIEKFGGDVNNVTLFGESAGSSSVTFHMCSPMSKGLFHKAIAQSGVSISDWAQGKHGKDRAFRAAKHLGNDAKDTAEVLEFLANLPASKLTRITSGSLTIDEKRRGLPIHFAPVVEKRFPNVEPFMCEEAIDALATGNMGKMPLMLGYNSLEGLPMLDDALKKLEFTNKNPQYLVPREIVQKVSDEKTVQFGERIKNFYIGNRDFTENDVQILTDMFSDIYFVYAIHRFTNFYSPLADTYLYKFNCDTDLNGTKNYSRFNYLKGASHADDLFYLFCNAVNKDTYKEQPKLQDIVYRLTKLWTDFAKTGNPTPDNALGVKWAPYTASNRAYLDINEMFTAGQNVDKTRVDFWNKVYRDSGLPCTTNSNL